MDGWNTAYACCRQPANFGYAYADPREVKPYWTMAKQYVLADHMFQSNLDGSFVSHQYAIAAYASASVNYPGTAWGCSGGQHDIVQTLTQLRTYGGDIVTCFNNPTIASEADAAGLTWRFYTGPLDGDGGIWSAYQAISPIYNSVDWNNDVVPSQSQFLSDIGNGQLANVTWITPTDGNSDHGGMDSTGGPAWVTSVVDAVGNSQFWNSSAIFVMWDDWGGFFDPVQPVPEDYDGLGFRVPLLMISPYAKKHYVAHKQYETASVPRYIEDNFGFAQLAAADARANDPAADAFNYSKPPRPFKNIPGAKPYQYWRQLELLQARQPRRQVVGGD
jgi:phospholipase C